VTLLWISETLASGRRLGRIDDPGKVPGIRDAGRIPGIEDPGEVPARYLWMRAWMAPPASISGSLIPGSFQKFSVQTKRNQYNLQES
jgi:hypothetical protein